MNILDKVIQFIQRGQVISPLADKPDYREVWGSPTPQFSPQPSAQPAEKDIAAKITKGYENWGSPPAATLSAVMASESQKYPILKQHPELLPVISILESGGMKNMPTETNSEFPGKVSQENKQFNGFGWGLNPIYNFNPQSPEEVIRKVAAGIATKPQFADFRKSGKIEDLAKVYSPYNKDTNPHGGDTYVKNYNSIASWFK